MILDANSILIDVNLFMLLVKCEGKTLKFIERKKITNSMLFSILSNIICRRLKIKTMVKS